MHLLCGVGALAATIGLIGQPGWRVSMLYGLTSLSTVVWLAVGFGWAEWTPELFVYTECAAGLLACLYALGAARHAGVRAEILFRALCLVLVSATLYVITERAMPKVDLYGYRGLVFADLATCVLLGVIGPYTPFSKLDRVALPYLSMAFGLSALRLFCYEVHLGLGRVFGWLGIAAWLWAMFCITRVSLDRRQH